MKRDDRVRIGHMVDALEAAIRFTQDRSRGDLEKDEILAFALVRAVEIAGEAASKVSAETRDQNQQIPWPEIIGMRNRLVHAYFDINLESCGTRLPKRLQNSCFSSAHW